MLPANHPLRAELNDEVHARPPERVEAPCNIVYLALVSQGERRDMDWHEARVLFASLGRDLPEQPINHLSVDVDGGRLVVERHTELIRYTLIVPSSATASDLATRVTTAFGRLSGQVLVATHVDVLAAGIDLDAKMTETFGGNTVIGATMGDGAGVALTDFRIRADQFSRLLIRLDKARPRQAGRMVQRLLEIDTYRMMALLALPIARSLRPQIEAMDQDLVTIARDIAVPGQAGEALLLEKLTALEARAQKALGETHYRLSASAAYEDIVLQRTMDLRETRIEGLQTFAEFNARRLAPAMQTCRNTAQILKDLSQRIAQTTTLLATRVEIVRERQNRELLATMARRAKMQLHMQRTVEGLSIIAVSYYVLGIIGYLLKGLKAAGLSFNVDLVTGLAVPVVVAAVAFGLDRLLSTLRSKRDE